MYLLPAAMKDMVFQRHSNCGGVERIEKSCGGFQYGSLLITIFNHKILIHNLEFLHFCKEHNKFIIKLLININPQKPILYRVPFYIGVTTMSFTNIKILSNHYFIFKNRNFII